jgi:kynurenine formamidase
MSRKLAGCAVRLLVAIVALASCSVARAQGLSKGGSLADAYKIISGKRFVDLTHTFSPTTPVWKGFGPAKFQRHSEDGFRWFVYTMVGQYGTHVDPPAHFDPKGRTLDEIALKQMILPMVVFDITPMLAKEPNYALSVADIQRWEQEHGRVPPGSFAALRTDMSKDWETNPERFKRSPFPAWSLDAIKFLYEQRGIVANGHESMDTDTTPDLQSESWLLHHGHWQIEVMANLDQVPATGALIVVTWPKPEHGLGFPARAFAILP